MSAFTRKLKSAAAVMMTFVCAVTFAGCDGGEEEESTVPFKTVEVTDEEGNTVTGEDGKPVFTEVTLASVTVTDDSGNPVTDEEGNPVTSYVDEDEEEKIVYKVGFVYSDELENGTTREMFEIARGQIKKVLGLETCYVENVLVSDFSEAVNVLQEDGCNIIVSCNPKYANAVEKEAKTSKSYFLNFGGKTTSAQMSSFGGALYQTAAVCGIAAAHNTTSNRIGIIADPGEYNVYGVVDGFVLGASEIWNYADMRLNWAWSNSESEIEAAVDDLISQGCDIIMSYMETDYAVKYCEGKGVKVIANCYYMPERYPDYYISGFFFNFSTYLVDEIRSIVNDNFNPSVYSGDVASGMIRLLNFGTTCEKGTEDICDKLYNYIKEGKDKVFTGEIKNNGEDSKTMVEKGQSMSFENILKINWLVQGIRKTGSFTEINENPKSSELEIKR